MKQICLNNRMGREKFPCHKFFCVSVWCYGVSQNTIFYEILQKFPIFTNNLFFLTINLTAKEIRKIVHIFRFKSHGRMDIPIHGNSHVGMAEKLA